MRRLRRDDMQGRVPVEIAMTISDTISFALEGWPAVLLLWVLAEGR